MTKFEHTKWANPADAKEYRDNAEHYLPERRVLLSVLTSFYRHFVAPLSSKRVLDLGSGGIYGGGMPLPIRALWAV